MFKVLIVDDEIYVVALIQKLISWEKFDMQVVATANDGLSALSLVKEIKPDLVIVDIRMPGYDGISFMDKVREFNTNVRFIVISGHKQFDYAKGAMRNNAEDYLLKPINKDELEQVLEHVHKQLLEIRERESMQKEMEEVLDSNRKHMREMLAAEIFRGSFREDTENLEQINKKFFTAFTESRFRLFSLVTDTPVALPEEGDNDGLLKEIRRKLQEVLRNCCEEVIFAEHKNMCIFLANYRKDQEEVLQKKLRENMVGVQQQIKKFENLSVYLCVSEAADSLTELKETSGQIWRCILGRTGAGNGKLIVPEDIRESEDLLPAIWDFRREKFLQALEALDSAAAEFVIREMYTKAFYGLEEDGLLYYKLYMKLAEEIWQYFTGIGICEESREEYGEKFRERFWTAGSSGAYIRILSAEINRLIEENQLSGNGQMTPAIRIVKRYIAEHYQEEISLSSAAQKVNFSPVYLSRLFKKEEGINFLDYLNQYRIDEAKRLLGDIQYNVLEVADLTGFKNTRYFSKIFKKNVGITPSEYRKRHLGKDEV